MEYGFNSVLVVEDSFPENGAYVSFLQQLGLKAQGVFSQQDAEKILSTQPFDVILTDMNLADQGREGLALLRACTPKWQNSIFIGMTGDISPKIFDEALEAGAAHLIRKPFGSPRELEAALISGISAFKRRGSYHKKTHTYENTSPAPANHAKDILLTPEEEAFALRVASTKTSLPSIISGETGTGKEVLVKFIHRIMNDKAIKSTPLVCINCGALEPNLAMSLLFGHKRGAFTGADSDTLGYIGEADGGVLFLDEVHTLSKECQSMLLRVTNDNSYRRLGDKQDRKSFFKLIVASRINLREEVHAGRFLPDLLQRLSGLNYHIRPLREKFHLLPTYLELFLKLEGGAMPKTEFATLVEECKKRSWHGNLRELSRAIMVMVAIAEDPNNLSAAALPDAFYESFENTESSADLEHPSIKTLEKDCLDIYRRTINGELDLRESQQMLRENIITGTLMNGQTKSSAAKSLGICRTLLWKIYGDAQGRLAKILNITG